MGKDGTQLLRHCVRLLVLVSTDLLAVRLSGIDSSSCLFIYFLVPFPPFGIKKERPLLTSCMS